MPTPSNITLHSREWQITAPGSLMRVDDNRKISVAFGVLFEVRAAYSSGGCTESARIADTGNSGQQLGAFLAPKNVQRNHHPRLRILFKNGYCNNPNPGFCSRLELRKQLARNVTWVHPFLTSTVQVGSMCVSSDYTGCTTLA